jgi:hypothetical protein
MTLAMLMPLISVWTAAKVAVTISMEEVIIDAIDGMNGFYAGHVLRGVLVSDAQPTLLEGLHIALANARLREP